MGKLIDGVWHDVWFDTAETRGKFVRSESQFRNWVTADGSPGPSGKGGFAAEPYRYHLYISRACPWAHRTLIFRLLKGLESMIEISSVNSFMGPEGWTFDAGPGVIPDPINDARALYDVYLAADPRYSGRVTVPVLWDKHTETIVSNESAEIIRMFNSAFDSEGAARGDYYPEPLRAEIDEINSAVYSNVNNGVYKAGFATTQSAYEEAVVPLFETLDMLEQRLESRRYLIGAQITEADWRLFTTLVRFDTVYYFHFKCNLRRIVDYENLWRYLRDLYQHPGIAATVDLEFCKQHYFRSHESVNPTRIVPIGPDLDFTSPHRREQLGNSG
jgi:putative glutathione S-transferase